MEAPRAPVPDQPAPTGRNRAVDEPYSVELRCSPDGPGLVAAARAQARLDGHPGVVSIHSAHLDSDGRGSVQLGWAGSTLTGLIARRGASCGGLAGADVAQIGVEVASVLADAHGMRPPLVHGAIDHTVIRLDRWGKTRLDAFGAGCHGHLTATPPDDVNALLGMLHRLLRTDQHESDGKVRQFLSRATAATAGGALGARELAQALSTLSWQGHGFLPPGSSAVSSTGTEAGAADRVNGHSTCLTAEDRTAILGDELQPTPGCELPKGFVPLRRLARGGHGDVWLARDHLLARDVVVKQYRNNDALERELRALGHLDGHRASVERYLFAHGSAPAPPAIVLGWCEGGALASDHPWSPTELAHLGAQVADALGVLHGRGLVHGDVKPQNLLADRWGAVRLADFSVTGADGARGSPECSPRHAPPEQLDGGALTPAADLAALAATLYHLGEGYPPLERGDGTEALVARRLSGVKPALPQSMASLPGLSTWVMAQLSPDPCDRPNGGAAVAAATLRALVRPTPCHLNDNDAPAHPTGHGQVDLRARLATKRFAWPTLPRSGTALTALGSLVASLLLASVLVSRAWAGPSPAPPELSDPQTRAGLRAAMALPPPDPLSESRPTDASLSAAPSGSAVLRVTGRFEGRPWLVRRDDFAVTEGLVDDRPFAFGVVGPKGSIAGPTHSALIRSNQASLRLPPGERSDGAAVTSCVRVIGIDLPDDPSPALCWSR